MSYMAAALHAGRICPHRPRGALRQINVDYSIHWRVKIARKGCAAVRYVMSQRAVVNTRAHDLKMVRPSTNSSRKTAKNT
ncbi:hypothetical protein BJ122_101136 [Rhodopseudomonas faecalis]|uniref:Uncharacterized protein n=1 Tax=Rhodopseudomonas faecalis TaxID=99655 RepID=A0A318TND3_9BRAD|nr:hypothetical protein BJ122_101136 [Rhodopseudomonas faecalis]